MATGRAASVLSSNSSLESGQWNSAALKRPVVSAYSRSGRDIEAALKRTLASSNVGRPTAWKSNSIR
ncbi:hypothetical protein C0Z16_35025 [Paraburkholderia rhynchosiae]|uniref:Uncharacterized protein n=1 Tax=Paraburkholderia rhynchosiae TaxID=487049 RepID=A0ABX4UTU1_9BURK|nr:hypothetical protein C0Z16_35025 [Paraburkholderia rhynchosiae]